MDACAQDTRHEPGTSKGAERRGPAISVAVMDGPSHQYNVHACFLRHTGPLLPCSRAKYLDAVELGLFVVRSRLRDRPSAAAEAGRT